ncbi:MAG: hypothetical protein WAN36_02825 [Calditrichia bacterium]
MSHGKSIISKIKDEKNKGVPSGPGGKYHFLQLEIQPCHFQLKYKDVGKYGIVLDYITISRGTPIMDVDLMNRKMSRQSEQVQKIVTYLLEDFKLIELDKMNKRAQLRSYPPHQKDDSKYYYEIVLDEGIQAHFQRYLYSGEKRRYEKTDSQLTIETFERLVDDLVVILCNGE